MEFIEIDWFCKHRKKVRSSQASISINSCTELSKTQLFLVSIVKFFITPLCVVFLPQTYASRLISRSLSSLFIFCDSIVSFCYYLLSFRYPLNSAFIFLVTVLPYSSFFISFFFLFLVSLIFFNQKSFHRFLQDLLCTFLHLFLLFPTSF